MRLPAGRRLSLAREPATGGAANANVFPEPPEPPESSNSRQRRMSTMQPKWFRRLGLAVGHVVWAVENGVVRGGKAQTIDNDGRYDVVTDEGSTLRGVAREKLCLRWQPGASPVAPAAAASQGGGTPDHGDDGGQAPPAGGGEVGWQGHVPSAEEVLKLAAAAEIGDSDTALMFRRSPEGGACRRRAVTGTLTEGDKRELPKCFHKPLGHLESPTNEPTGTKAKPADYLSVRKFYSVRIGEFTVFLEAGDGKKTRDLEPCT